MSEPMTLDELVESCTDNPNADDIRQWIVDFVEQSIRPFSDATQRADKAEDLVRRCIRAEEAFARMGEDHPDYGDTLTTVAKIHSEMQRMCPEAPK